LEWFPPVNIPQPKTAPLAGGQNGPSARLIAWSLALITVLVYLPVWSHGFIFMDDPNYVTDNPVVQNGLTWAGLKWAFVGWHATYWHPLTWLSHQLDCQLFGLNAGAHHLVNVLFHAANAVLLFYLWLRLTKACWPSALVAALFAWHPLHVESVAWVAERKDVLSAFFGLLALLAYTRYAEETGSPQSVVRDQRSVYYGASLVAFALALLAKPMLVTLPFVLLLLDYWPLRRWTGSSLVEGWERIREKSPFFLLSALFCLVTFLAQRQKAVVLWQQLPLGFRLENAVVAVAAYLGKTFWPVDLAVYYQLPGQYSTSQVVLPALLLTVVSLLAWRWRRTHPCVLIGWLWFLGMLVPVIGLVQVGYQAMADRFTYLPGVGLFVAAVFGLSEACGRWRFPAPVLRFAAILMLGACVAVTGHQLTFWRDTETLFQHTLAVTKNNGMAHLLLGSFYEKQGRSDEARRQFNAALDCFASITVDVDGEKRPLAAQIHLQFGQDAEQKGRADEAIAHYRAALRLDASLVEAHNNLANLLDDQGQPEESLTHYEAAVRLRPQTPLVHENLGTELVKLGRFDDALREYQAAARLAPASPQPSYLTGKAWLRRGQSAEAVAAFQNALRLDPEDYPSLVYLARLLASDHAPQIRNGAQAVALAEKANTLTGGTQPFVLGTLAMAYAEAGRFADARQTARTALSLASEGGGKMTASLQEQLKLYEANQPFREPENSRSRPGTPP
jgi:tetratricopeptide (TPR) repeat protein